MTTHELWNIATALPNTDVMPVLFVGHGSPLNAIEHNSHTATWDHLGSILPTPKLIVVISAHWLTKGTHVDCSAKPKTIHDMYGFPAPLYEIQYPAPGFPEVAKQLIKKSPEYQMTRDDSWGLDHGTWSVLTHMYPNADIPTFQISLNIEITEHEHFNIGSLLQTLRSHGVLLLASGNIVHNLRSVNWGDGAKAFDWAISFDAEVERMLRLRDVATLCDYHLLPGSEESVPTPDHYWPLLYALGASTINDRCSFPIGNDIVMGSISMRAVLFEK